MTTPTEQAAIAALLAGELEADAVLMHYWDSAGRRAQCRLRSFRSAATTVLICTELRDNPGASITNAAPAPWQVAEDVVDLEATVIWLEHYAPESDGRSEHTFDRVGLDAAGLATWRHLARVPEDSRRSRVAVGRP
jgi:hypothetical protein